MMTDAHGLLQFVSVVTFASILGIRAFRGQPASHRLMAASALAVLIIAPALVSAWPRLLWPLGLESASAARAWLNTPVPALWLIGWASVFAAAAGVLWRSVTSARRHIDTLPLCRDRWIATVCDQLRRDLDVSAAVVVRVSTELGPCSSVTGPPTIVLPVAATRWEPQIVRAVLAHELVHVARRDGMILVLAKLCRAAYWFVPWAGKLERALLRSIEESCDDLAAEQCPSARSYATSLAFVASVTGGARPTMPAMGHNLVAPRLARLLTTRDNARSPVSVSVTLCAWVGLALLITSFEPVEPTRIEERSYQRDAVLDERQSHPQSRRYTQSTRGALSVVAAGPIPQAIYPGKALLDGAQGEAVVEYRVGRDGAPSRFTVVRASDAIFGEAATRAVRNTTYRVIDDRGGLNASAIVRERFEFSAIRLQEANLL